MSKQETKKGELIASFETKTIEELEAQKIDQAINLPATKTQGDLVSQDAEAWGHGSIGAQHLLLPRVLIMQGLSKLVSEGQASVGEIRDSLEGKLLGGKVNPLEFIVFHADESVITYKNENGKFEYMGEAKVTAANADLPFESADGMYRYDRSLNFYALLPHDIASGEAFPVVISFRRTSFKTGRKLTTQMFKLQMMRKSSASKAFKVKSIAEENDKGKYFVFDLVNESRWTTPEELSTAKMWNEQIAKSLVRVDDSDLRKETFGEKLDTTNTNF